MNDLTANVWYRARSSDEGPTVYQCKRVVEAQAVFVIYQEDTMYGGQTVTRIPWDLIRRVETKTR